MFDVNKISDIYISEADMSSSFYFPGPTPFEDGEEFVAGALLQEAKSKNKTDFIVEFEGFRFRGALIPTVEGNFYIFRKMPKSVWTLTQCGLRKVVQKLLLHERLNSGGLVIVSGMPGNGKSTTCSALVAERLSRFGGICNTIEDPAEMPLHGFHGKGFCLQREVERGESASEAVVDTLRAYPAKENTMMLIGEVRDASTAALALQSAVDGRLVVFTTHAGDVIDTIRRIINLASGAPGMSYNQARELFAASFRLILHQKLIDEKLKVNVLADTQQAAGVLRSDSDLAIIKNTLVEQTTAFKKGEEVVLRTV